MAAVAKKMGFREWVNRVDVLVWEKVSVGLYDLPDVPIRAMYDDGYSPARAASAAIKNAKDE
jgi:hypothetical protein